MRVSIAGSDAQESAIDILYEDEALLAVNKPAGIVTHPAYRHPDGTLWDAVLARQSQMGQGRPWLLHRLDRETSGVVLFAKTAEARRALVRQFERHTIQKRYLALLAGSLPDREGVIDAPLARDLLDRRRTIVASEGQPSCTRYWAPASENGVTLALAEPVTGRTRQIRAHFASVGAPLLGDTLYYPERHWGAQVAPRAMLHAWRLGFQYPGTGAQLTIAAPVPFDFVDAARRYGLDIHLDNISGRFPSDETEESLPCN
ncbi:MAG TPA: RluA family pseudouridine synthase [Ktedonobacterales bacterium]|nr:RluA family pseudouridine synthase [Ktedonobacterales bacterium]